MHVIKITCKLYYAGFYILETKRQVKFGVKMKGFKVAWITQPNHSITRVCMGCAFCNLEFLGFRQCRIKILYQTSISRFKKMILFPLICPLWDQ